MVVELRIVTSGTIILHVYVHMELFCSQQQQLARALLRFQGSNSLAPSSTTFLTS